MKLEPSSSRDPRIDFLRGFALVSILINHAQQLAGIYYFVPTIKHLHPGLSDSAELFVFLSGLSIALAYGPRIRVGQTGQANVLILLRWFRIYALHLLIVGAVVLLFRLVYDGPAERVPVGLAGLSGNGQAWLDVISLRLQPSYMNILPLYLMLLLATPVLLLGFIRIPSWTWVMSGSIYLISLLAFEFGFAERLIPAEVRWSFFPPSWQLIYVFGLWCGLNWKSWMRWRPSLPALAMAWLVFAAATSFRIWIWISQDMKLLEALPINKRFLEPLLLIHFASLMLLWQRYVDADQPWLNSALARMLRLMGRHSLEVFALGTVISFLVAFSSMESGSRWIHMVGCGLGVLISYLLALAMGRWRQRMR